MRTSKKITLSAMAAALSAVLLALSSLLGLMELTVGAIASLLVVFIHVEVGAPYQWLVWLVTSLIALLLLPSKTIGFAYLLVFGIYPILKSFIERLPRWSWLIIKFVYISAILAACIFLSELVLGVGFFADLPELSSTLATLAKIGVVALFYVAFFAYDAFIAVLVRLYYLKYREKFKRLLK